MWNTSKARDLLAAPFAISPIIQRFWLPGAIGIPLAAIGAVQEIHWLAWTGFILALPILWTYAVLLLGYLPLLLFESIRKRIR